LQWVWYVLGSVTVILVIAGAVLYRSYKERLPYGRDSSVVQMLAYTGAPPVAARDSSFSIDNPSRGTTTKRESLTEKFARVSRTSMGSGYNEVDEQEVAGAVVQSSLVPSHDRDANDETQI
jgi:hypothetical protein